MPAAAKFSVLAELWLPSGCVGARWRGADANILGIFEPVERFEGGCIAVIQYLDDDKVVLAPEGVQDSDEQILTLTEFQARFFKPVVILG